MRGKREVKICLYICVCITIITTVFIYFHSKPPEELKENDQVLPTLSLDHQTLFQVPVQTSVQTANKGSKTILHRHARTIIHELWRLVNSQLSNKTFGEKLKEDELLDILSDMTLLLETKLSASNRVDGQAAELVHQLDAVAKQVQDRFKELQYPGDCKNAKFLVAEVSKVCGFGCRAHHWAYCLGISYALNRTLYLPNESEDADFLPVTNCEKPQGSMINFVSASPKDKVVYCPIIDVVRSKLLPPALITNLADLLEGLHGAPSVWFLGQALSYLFRLKPSKFKEELEQSIAQLRTELPTHNYRQPVAGVHIRRTDKIKTEAKFHELSEYMVHVERFFQKKGLEHQIATEEEGWFDDAFAPPSAVKEFQEKPRVFIASDDPGVIAEAKKKYTQYTIIGEEKRAESATVGKRSSRESIQDIITDIMMLANTDFLSCTFSSQVCRLAYELMQSHHTYLGDASSNYESLDSMYYFGGQQAFPWRSMMDYPNSNIHLGDNFYVFPNYWNGFVDVENAKTKVKSKNVPAFLFYPLQLRIPVE